MMVVAAKSGLKKGLAVVIGLAVLGGLWWHFSGNSKPQASGNGPVVTVQKPVQQRLSDELEFSGQFRAVDLVEIRARVSGYLTEIHFRDGQYVNKGDLLFTIDPRPFEIALQSAKAKLDEALSARDFASAQLQRAGELQRRDFTARQTYDQRQNESRSAAAAVEAARAAVREAELDLQFSRVTAPISGRVSSREISPGNLVTGGGQGGTLLTTIVSQDPMYFIFDMSEADFLLFQNMLSGDVTALDMPIKLKRMDEQGWNIDGRLTFIDNQVSRSTGTMRARATIDNKDGKIASGSFGRILLAVSQPYDALLVPEKAFVADQSAKLLMTVTAENKIQPKPVVVGQRVGDLRVVRSGITADDVVVVGGVLRTRPGAVVTPKPVDAAPNAPAAQPAQAK